MKRITTLLLLIAAFQFVNAQKTAEKEYPYFFSYGKVKITGEEKTYIFITPVEQCSTELKDQKKIMAAFGKLVEYKNEGKPIQSKTGDNNFYETLEEAKKNYEEALKSFSDTNKYIIIKLPYSDLKAFLENE